MGFMDDTPTIRGKGYRRPKAVIYHVIVCPVCKCRNCPVVKTEKPIRYHKCNDCGHNFKSVEQM